VDRNAAASETLFRLRRSVPATACMPDRSSLQPIITQVHYEAVDLRMTISSPAMTWESSASARHHEDANPGQGILPGKRGLAADAGLDGIIVPSRARSEDSGRRHRCSPRDHRCGEGRIPILVDSGFRRGPTMIKALCMGATAALIGRPLSGLGARSARSRRVLDLRASRPMPDAAVGAPT